MKCMCLILLNMNLFHWRLVLMMFLYLRAVMKFTLLHFAVSYWLDMDYRTCWTVVGSFLPIPRIQKLVLFLAGNASFHGMIFSDWDMYGMLWWSQYCVIIPMGVPLGGNLILYSNIPSLIKGWSERSIFKCWKGGNICAKHKFRTWWPSFAKFIFVFINIFRWKIFEFLGVWFSPFHCGHGHYLMTMC